MDAGPGPGSLTTSALNGGEQLDWQFLQCFGERTPGEEIQEGVSNRSSNKLAAKRHMEVLSQPAPLPWVNSHTYSNVRPRPVGVMQLLAYVQHLTKFSPWVDRGCRGGLHFALSYLTKP